jgi:adenylosuccinate synthase
LSKLVLLSGPLCAGKTSLALSLHERDRAKVISVRQILVESGARPDDRRDLQRVGQELEQATAGAWLVTRVMNALSGKHENLVVVDAVRTKRQVDALRKATHDSILVHITASTRARTRRFNRRRAGGVSDAGSLILASMHPTEVNADRLAAIADYVIDSTGRSSEATYGRFKSVVRLPD